MRATMFRQFCILLVGLLATACATGENPSELSRSTNQATGSPSITPARQEKASETVSPTKEAEDAILNLNTYKIILIGVEDPPYASITESIRSSAEAAIESVNVNAASNGFKIDLIYAAVTNNAEDIRETFLARAKKYQPLLVLMAAPVDGELHEAINGLRIPVLYLGLGASRLDAQDVGEDYLFWLTPLPDEQFAFFLDQTWRYWEDIRPPGNLNEFKIGYLTWAEQPNKLALTQGLDAFKKLNQFDFIYEGTVSNTPNASVTNFLLQCITFGITVIYTDTFNYGPMVLLNDLYSLGLNDFFVIGGSAWSYDLRSLKSLLAPNMAETFYVPLPVQWWSAEDDPAIRLANQILEGAGLSEQDKNLAILMALGAVDIAAHVIVEGEKKTGDAMLTTRDVYFQLERLDGYEVLDGLFEIDYTKGNRSPKNLRLWAVDIDQLWQPIGEVGTVPDLSAKEKD